MQVAVQTDDPIPVFVISFNRGDYLARVIRSYRQQDIAIVVVVHDNGSDDPDTIRILDDLESTGVLVYRYGQITAPDELNGVNRSLEHYMTTSGYRGPYVVTDCDIDLSSSRCDALRAYLEVLDTFDDAECVGPMLTIADIPQNYPLFHRVMARHVAQFWSREPDWVTISGGRTAYLRHRIDTTFAVHRAGTRFRRLKDGIRLYHPYEAKHLDWYVSEDCQNAYRSSSSRAISHWNNDEEFRRYKSDLVPDLSYVIVDGQRSALRTVVRSTADHPL